MVVEDLREELRGEYRVAMKILNKMAESADERKALAAKKVLNDRDLLIAYIERRYEKNIGKLKKEKKALTGWKRWFRFSFGRATA